jgi:hypothetical protein
MKESRKEFIKQAHKSARSDWKEKIEAEFPELFKKDALVVGKWYNGYEDYLLFITKIKQEIRYKKIYYYGFASGYVNEDYIANTDIEKSLKPATDKEVEEALIKEAKKRGFKEGVMVIGLSMYSGVLSEKNTSGKEYGNYIFGDFYMNISNTKNACIFKNGIWAEIIKLTITKEQAEKKLGKTIIN